MQLVRWSPFPELDTMERRMRRIFDEVGIVPAPLPAADVYETEGEFVFELEVPGFEEKQLEVEVTDHTLLVKGERKAEKEEKGKTFRLHERLASQFERRFTLPPEADTAKIDAAYEGGVLTIHAPKEKSATKPRTVKIAAR
jgi:HSP20 family protein